MTKGKLEIMLREAGTLARDRDFFLFGSQSLRAILSNYPRDFPESLEADLYPRNCAHAWNLLRQQMGRGSKFFRKHGVYLDCVDPGLATLPDGWSAGEDAENEDGDGSPEAPWGGLDTVWRIPTRIK